MRVCVFFLVAVIASALGQSAWKRLDDGDPYYEEENNGEGSGLGGQQSGDGSGSGSHQSGDGSGSGGHQSGDGSGSGGQQSGDGSGSGSHQSGDGSGSGGQQSGDGSGSGSHQSGDGSGSGGQQSGDGSGSGSHQSGDGSGSGGQQSGDGSGSGSHQSGDGSGSGGQQSGDGSGSGSRQSGEDDRHSREGSGCDKSGSKEETKCEIPFFKTILKDFRAFPSSVETVLTGYDPTIYDPILDEFWVEKDDSGLDTALKDLGVKFLRILLADRYRCRATQFNQVLISMLENRTDSFIAEKMTELVANFTEILQKISDLDQSRLNELPNEIIQMINRTMHNTVISYIEDQEFKDVGCFMKDAEERLRDAIENGDTLDDVKADMEMYSLQYLDVFTCTHPSRIMEIYREGWNLLTMPRGEKNILVHLKHELKNILAKDQESQARRRIVRILTTFVHRFIIRVVKPLRPVIDIESKDRMVNFLQNHLPTERFPFAEQVIESIWYSLGLMTPPPTHSPPATQSPAWTKEPSTALPPSTAVPPVSPETKVRLHLSYRNPPDQNPANNPKTGTPTIAPPKNPSNPKTAPPTTAPPKKPSNPKTGPPSATSQKDKTQPTTKQPTTAAPSEQKTPVPSTESPEVSKRLFQRMQRLEKMRRHYFQMMKRRRILKRMQEYANRNSDW